MCALKYDLAHRRASVAGGATDGYANRGGANRTPASLARRSISLGFCTFSAKMAGTFAALIALHSLAKSAAEGSDASVETDSRPLPRIWKP